MKSETGSRLLPTGIKKRAAIVTVGIMALFCMGACNKSLPDGPSPDNEAGTYVYIPEYMELPDVDNAALADAKILGDSLYYAKTESQEGQETVRRYLCEYSLTQKQMKRKILLSEDTGGYIYDFCVAEDGRIYVLDYPMSQSSTQLLVFDCDGKLQMQLDCMQLFMARVVSVMTVDSQNRIYVVLSDGGIALVNADGSLSGIISLTEERVHSLGVGKDGKVYAAYEKKTFTPGSDRNLQLAEVSFDKKKLDNKIYNNYPVNMHTNLIPGGDYDFLANDGSNLWGYSLKTEAAVKLLDWTDCGIDVDPAGAFSCGIDGRIQVLTKSGMGRTAAEMTVLKKTEVSLLPQKTELVLGALNAGQDLKAAVIAFNRQSDTCHITIKNYQYEKADGSWMSDDEARQNMNIDIISADRCPDLFDLRNLNVEAFAGNGVFENLEPWLAQSSILNREDFLENVLVNYTYGDVLTAIPVTVMLSTLIGRTDLVGEKPGWTVDEMIAVWEKNTDISLFSVCYNQSVLRDCLHFGKRRFIDQNTASANFDSDEFKKLLQFANLFPSPQDMVVEGESDQKRMKRGELLLSHVLIDSAWDIQMYDALYGGITFIGFPTDDGSNGCMLETDNACAIASKCKEKQAAWEFLEFLLQSGNQKWSADDFPCNKKDLNAKISAVEYVRDKNGDLYLDYKGNPTPRYQSIHYNGEYYEYHAVTDAEAALVMDLLESAQFVSYDDNVINVIIYGETEAFFQSQKSAEEAASAVQNRVQLYLDENR